MNSSAAARLPTPLRSPSASRWDARVAANAAQIARLRETQDPRDL